jgi:putative DNA-invertase from lambdoid prophage Rac
VSDHEPPPGRALRLAREARANHVALYLRVSSADQELAGQERELREYAASRHWPIGAVFAEKVTGTGKVERDAWEQLRKEACLPTTRRFERVLVWALDRWSRDPSFVKAIGSIEELELLGIKFHSMKEAVLDSTEDDSANLARDLLRGILPTIAAFEARRRSERTRVAMREIKSGRRPTRSGRPPGRPRRVTPEVAARIRELRWGKGLPWKEVAQHVHLPAGTCSKVPRAPHSETPRSEKGPGGFGETDGLRADVPAPAREA